VVAAPSDAATTRHSAKQAHQVVDPHRHGRDDQRGEGRHRRLGEAGCGAAQRQRHQRQVPNQVNRGELGSLPPPEQLHRTCRSQRTMRNTPEHRLTSMLTFHLHRSSLRMD